MLFAEEIVFKFLQSANAYSSILILFPSTITCSTFDPSNAFLPISVTLYEYKTLGILTFFVSESTFFTVIVSLIIS